MIIPVDLKFLEYAEATQNALHAAGFYVDVDGKSF
jgi:threonyl-tRNA synthetase